MNDFMTSEDWEDMERRLKLIEEAIEGMENPRVMTHETV